MKLSMSIRQRMGLHLSQYIYETSGELELLSLHRIKNRISSLDVDPDVKDRLVSELIRENQAYRRDHNNKWSCITPIGLDNAVSGTRKFLEEHVELGFGTLDNGELQEVLRQQMYSAVDVQEKKIKEWFYRHYEEIIYDTSRRIPYPVLMQMRGQLGLWAMKNTNPFQQPIEDLVSDAARSVGLDPDKYATPENVWEALGKHRES
jgi:hypothetical protein